VLTFLLNFIPNIGMATSVLLPMPVVLLDPKFGLPSAAVSFFCPLLAGLAAKDILEPLLIGHSTSLQPVAVLFAIMLWGSVWGATGMVLAVPITAVVRIYLAALEHPLPRYFASLLAGKEGLAEADDPLSEADFGGEAALNEEAGRGPAEGGGEGASSRG